MHAAPADLPLGGETFPETFCDIGGFAESLRNQLGIGIGVLRPRLDAGSRIDADDAVGPHPELA